MIYFQVSHKVSELNVVRDKSKKEEERKFRATRIIIWLNLAYHLIKVVIPTSTLISCIEFDLSDSDCQDVTNHRI